MVFQKKFSNRCFGRLAALCSLIMLAGVGCASHVPLPVTYPYSTQQKMQAAHHWDVLAEDVAAQVRQAVAGEQANKCTDLSVDDCTSVYVEQPVQGAIFHRTFHDLLITRLLKQGVNVSTTKADSAMQMYYKVHVVHHEANRFKPPVPGMFSGMTALAGGIAVIRHAAAAWTTAGLAAIGLDIGIGHQIWGLPHYEVVISSAIEKDGTYLMHDSSIYYINDEDASHYFTPTLQVRGSFDEEIAVAKTGSATEISFPDELLFDFNSSDLQPGAYQKITDLALQLKQSGSLKLLVEGHTDSEGSDGYNMRLAMKRARAVKNALVMLGIDPARITTTHQGESKPVLSNASDAGRQHNRRVRMVLIPAAG